MFSLSYSCKCCGVNVSMASPVSLPADELELNRRGLCRSCFIAIDRWHPASDLPPESGSYIVCSSRRDKGSRAPVVSVFPAHYYRHLGKWSHRRGIVAWRPLPLPAPFTPEI